ncbi:hypothetical protein E4U60_004367 [Claviceps pazoutovae]|uniref:Uncharacterized protein n=1 Tax=Claviceps pazoutovae TaxID=1649127 RepID=A0A9P7M8S9_9HYPO|nr:hypothetical protein E4U60_004367 [Claviceps pazoutovae]
MESSPVVKAHDHAAAAAVATRQSSDTTVAINEHTLAAGEFSNAAQSTTSIEALRTLKLLEEHHRQLAELLKLPPHQASRHNDDQVSEKASQSEKGSLSPENGLSKKLPSLTQRGCSARDMSSSIASNLASARGIRSKYRGQPLSPSISNDQAPGNVEKHLRREGSRSKMRSIINTQPSRPTWVPPTSVQSPRTESRNKNKSAVSSPRVDHTTASGAAAEKGAGAEDVGYARFYNTFGSIINKISAPLAFAGLPLIQEESTSVSEQSNKHSIESSSSSSSSPPLPPLPPAPKRKSSRPGPLTASVLDPDLSKIYSKATMRALAREGHSATDSFYVVPTSGHTMSYANILSYAEKEKRRLSASHHSDTDLYHSRHNAEDEEDDFVDASETPPVISTSPGARRKGVPSRTEKELRNTIEELSLENRSLKDMLDNVSKRLHAFEASSQHSAMALAESYRIMRPGSPVSVAVSPPLMKSKPGDEALRQKTQDMEEQLAAATAHMERLEKDNRKMQKTLDKYREKWEVLKAGAKARRGAQTESVEDS